MDTLTPFNSRLDFFYGHFMDHITPCNLLSFLIAPLQPHFPTHPNISRAVAQGQFHILLTFFFARAHLCSLFFICFYVRLSITFDMYYLAFLTM